MSPQKSPRPTARASAPKSVLRAMKNTNSFRDFVVDQLAAVRDVKPRAMFGGIGLYAGEVFFGIVASDVLYLKVDDTTRPVYAARGSAPFKPYADRPMTMPYFNVPVDVLEDAATLTAWARQSVEIAKAGAKNRATSTTRRIEPPSSGASDPRQRRR